MTAKINTRVQYAYHSSEAVYHLRGALEFSRGGRTRTKTAFGKLCKYHPESKGERYLQGMCVECLRVNSAKYAAAHRKEAVEAVRLWRKKHRAEIKALTHKYYVTARNRRRVQASLLEAIKAVETVTRKK